MISGYTTEERKSKIELESLSPSQRYFYELKRGDSYTVSNLEKVTFLSNSPQVKRFRFWLFRPHDMNAQVYLFELSNETATKSTDLGEFIKNSKLTFLKDGWIII